MHKTLHLHHDSASAKHDDFPSDRLAEERLEIVPLRRSHEARPAVLTLSVEKAYTNLSHSTLDQLLPMLLPLIGKALTPAPRPGPLPILGMTPPK